MKKVVVGVVAAAAVAGGVVVLTGAGVSGQAGESTEPARQPVSVCETRRVGRDVEVMVRLQLTDRQLDRSADQALVVADLGDVTQTRVLRADERNGAGYAVTFEDLPADVTPSSFSVRAIRSPDDPATFACDSSAAGPAPTTRVSSPTRDTLPSTGG